MDDNKIMGRRIKPFLRKTPEFYEWLQKDHEAYSIRHEQAARSEFCPSPQWPRTCLKLRVFRVTMPGF
jgi:hypothetical protein